MKAKLSIIAIHPEPGKTFFEFAYQQKVCRSLGNGQTVEETFEYLKSRGFSSVVITKI